MAIPATITAAAAIGFIRPAKADAPTERESVIIKKFLELFPDQSEHVLSYITDSACNCRVFLIKALNERPDLAQQFVDFLYSNLPDYIPRPKFVVTFDTIEKRAEGIQYYGDIVEIPQDPAAYRNLIHALYAARKVFNGLFILPTEKTWKIFFY